MINAYDETPKRTRMRKYLLGAMGIAIVIPVAFLGYLIYTFEYETQKLIQYQPRLTTEVYDRN